MKELTKEEIIELAKEISIGVKDSELEWITRRFASACKNTNCLEYIDTLEDVFVSTNDSLHELREDTPNKYDDKQVLSNSENKEGNLIVIKL